MPNILKMVPKKTSDLMYSTVHQGKGFYSLLVGDSKFLRTESALYLAKNYLCQGTRDEDCPCSSCRKFPEDNPDVLVLSPSASGNMLKESSDACISFLEDISLFTGKKVVVLQEVDKFTPAALGSLLKILEEKIPSASIIMTSNSRNKVEPTIRSRCQIFFTGDNTRVSLFQRLSSDGANAKTSEELSRVGTWISGDACEDKDKLLAVHKALPKILASLMKGDSAKALGNFSEFAAKARVEDITMLSEVILATLVDIQKVSFMASSHISQPSRLEWISSLKDGVSDETLLKSIALFTRVKECLPKHRRAMLIWAMCGMAEEIRENKPTTVKES
jgi:hypothetical protein